MVVGETARACEFSIYGYNRPTTPLMQRERGLVAFSNVMSQSNTTHKACLCSSRRLLPPTTTAYTERRE